MALHVKSVGSESPASNYVSVRHSRATGGGQKRVIKLSRAANDNRASRRWVLWLGMAGLSAVIGAVLAFAI